MQRSPAAAVSLTSLAGVQEREQLATDHRFPVAQLQIVQMKMKLAPASLLYRGPREGLATIHVHPKSPPK